MKWWILGIISVFCLQLGFIEYTAIDRRFETLVAVNEVTSDSDSTANALAILNGDEFLNLDADQDSSGANIEEIAVSTPYRRKSKRPDAVVYRTKAVKARSAIGVKSVPQFVALLKPTQITIRTEHPTAIAGASENKPLLAQSVPRSPKRSFISKSVSVLKKPYDWLKAIGSRLK